MIVTEACTKTVSHEAKSLKLGEKSENRFRVAGSIVSISRHGTTLASITVRDRVGDLRFVLSRNNLGGQLVLRAGDWVHDDLARGWGLVEHLVPGDDIVGEGVIRFHFDASVYLWLDLLEKL